jgi:hypothetical protein
MIQPLLVGAGVLHQFGQDGEEQSPEALGSKLRTDGDSQ